VIGLLLILSIAAGCLIAAFLPKENQ